MKIARNIIEKILRKLYKATIRHKIRKLRNKDKIKVLFILNDLSKWKSESLYREMIGNEKFEPILGVTYRRGESVSSYSQKVLTLIKYLNDKDYKYIELDKTLRPNPEIVIYTEPYGEAVPRNQSIFAYWNSLFISINYSCHTTHLDIDYFTRLHECAWIDCYESRSAIQDAYKYIGYRRKSLQLTGLPMLDQFREESVYNPWRQQEKKKKRIIWAPHHSLGFSKVETIVYGNFLEHCQYMLELADEFQEEVQFAFKPHPLLKEKLQCIWGTNRTNDYYEKWDQIHNGQLEIGAYQDLFKHSDALIHDSSSFIVEYQLLNKPILFMVRDEDCILKDMNSFGRRAFYAQTLGYEKEDIRKFILSVIQGIDPMAVKRLDFLKEDIVETIHTSACKRIINTVLSSI